MKKLTPITLFLAIFLCIPVSLRAQSPYQCSWEKDSYILGTGAITAATGLVFYRSVSSPSITDLNQLSSETVNWFDKSATNHYSETAATVSDILYGAAAVAPFVLFANETMRNIGVPLHLCISRLGHSLEELLC